MDTNRAGRNRAVRSGPPALLAPVRRVPCATSAGVTWGARGRRRRGANTRRRPRCARPSRPLRSEPPVALCRGSPRPPARQGPSPPRVSAVVGQLDGKRPRLPPRTNHLKRFAANVWALVCALAYRRPPSRRSRMTPPHPQGDQPNLTRSRVRQPGRLSRSTDVRSFTVSFRAAVYGSPTRSPLRRTRSAPATTPPLYGGGHPEAGIPNIGIKAPGLQRPPDRLRLLRVGRPRCLRAVVSGSRAAASRRTTP
jgi:hypothetical protein